MMEWNSWDFKSRKETKSIQEFMMIMKVSVLNIYAERNSKVKITERNGFKERLSEDETGNEDRPLLRAFFSVLYFAHA